MASRVLGQLRSSLLAALLGTTYFADIFYLAFKIPNLFRRLFAEGAMSAVFIPMFNQLAKSDNLENGGDGKTRISEQDFFALISFALGCMVIGLVVLVIFFAPTISSYFFLLNEVQDSKRISELTRLIQIMMPYLGLISSSAISQSVLQSKHRFAIPAFTPILFNLAFITMGASLLFMPMPLEYYLDKFHIYYFSDIHFLKVVLLATSVVMGGVLQWAYPWWTVRRMGYGVSPWRAFKVFLKYRRHPSFVKFFKLMVPIFFSSGIYQINVFLVDPIAFSVEEGAVALLFYSNRLLELPLGIIGVAVTTVSLPLLSKHAAYTTAEEKVKFENILFRSVRLLFLFIPPILFIAIMLRSEIVSLLFGFGNFDQVAIEKTAKCFLFHVLSLPAIFFYRLFYQVFYAQNDTRTPLVAALVGLIVSLSLSIAFVEFYRHPAAIALASSASSYVVMFYLVWKLKAYQIYLLKPMLKYAGFYTGLGLVVGLVVVVIYYGSMPWVNAFYELQIGADWGIWGAKLLLLAQITMATLLFTAGYGWMVRRVKRPQFN